MFPSHEDEGIRSDGGGDDNDDGRNDGGYRDAHADEDDDNEDEPDGDKSIADANSQSGMMKESYCEGMHISDDDDDDDEDAFDMGAESQAWKEKMYYDRDCSNNISKSMRVVPIEDVQVCLFYDAFYYSQCEKF